MTAEKKKEGPITSAEVSRTPQTNEALRTQLADEVQSYLAQGGSVTEVERGRRVDLPKKPENKYGSRPI